MRVFPLKYAPNLPQNIEGVKYIVPIPIKDPAKPATLSGFNSVRPREFTDVQTHDDRVLGPLAWRKPARVFVNSMSDLFHEDVPDQFITDVFGVMALAHWHTFQVLTKRPERMRAFLQGGDHGIVDQFRAIQQRGGVAPKSVFAALDLKRRDSVGWQWPLPNVWLGVSCENQHFADERIPLLLQTPAAVRFISAEPLLGAIDISTFLTADDSDNPLGGSEHTRTDGDVPAARVAALQQQRLRWDKSTGHDQGDQEAERSAVRKSLDWVIVGGGTGSVAPVVRPRLVGMAFANPTLRAVAGHSRSVREVRA